MVSLKKALLNPYFRGGTLGGGLFDQSWWFRFSNGHPPAGYLCGLEWLQLDGGHRNSCDTLGNGWEWRGTKRWLGKDLWNSIQINISICLFLIYGSDIHPTKKTRLIFASSIWRCAFFFLNLLSEIWWHEHQIPQTMVPPSQGDRILAARLARSASTPFRHHLFQLCKVSLFLLLSQLGHHVPPSFPLKFKLNKKAKNRSDYHLSTTPYVWLPGLQSPFVGEALARNLWVLNSQALKITHAPTWQLDQLACSAAASQLARWSPQFCEKAWVQDELLETDTCIQMYSPCIYCIDDYIL